jgi:DMATS type aromatic prenyltransferase
MSDTLVDVGSQRLRSLCRSLGYTAGQSRSVTGLFRRMATSWAERPADGAPAWSSDITDDHTPFEFSLAIDGASSELRFLLEAQGDSPSLASNWEEACRLNELLAAEEGACLTRFAAVADLFAPTPRCNRFALWHAVCLQPGAPPDFKIYLNPQARGPAEARATVEEAMARLGLADATAYLPLSSPDDELLYFSLDLSARREARVKVYTAHHRANAKRIEAAVAPARGHVTGQALDFCLTMGESVGPFSGRPVLSCLSFVQGSATPTNGTVHFPVRSYVSDDAVAAARICSYMGPEGAALYQRALDAFTDRRLEDGVGMQTYASLRINNGRRRVTVYLAPEVYDIRPAAMTQPAVSGVMMRPSTSSRPAPHASCGQR